MKLLIVDDEPLARSALIQLCHRNAHLLVVGEAESGVAAIEAAEKLRPDVMLLDVGLPDMSGFDVLRAARKAAQTHGIMVTAHADHAANAFDAGALDYLVKPVSADRFARSIERVRQRIDAPDTTTAQAQSLRPPHPACGNHDIPRSPFKLLIGERDHRMYPMKAETVDYIESDGNYVTLRSGNSKYISRDSVKRLSAELAEFGFIRIERSLLLNIRAILHIQPVGRGTFAFTLSSGACLHSSGSYRDSILQILPMRPLAGRRGSR